MRSIAMTAAAMGFFGMAVVGWLSDVPPLTCGIRALIGVAAVYVLVILAARVLMNIIISAIIKNAAQRKKTRNTVGEHTD